MSKSGSSTPQLLITPGTFAVRTMGTLAFCLCLLLLFYTVESLERERSTRLAAIAYATPIRTVSLFLGKGLAMLAVAMAIILAVALAGVIVHPDPAEGRSGARPFLLVWGLLLTPTVLVWTGARDGGAHDHAKPLHDLSLCAWPSCASRVIALLTNQINWVGNWPLWRRCTGATSACSSSTAAALVLSRVLAVSLAVFLVVLTLAFFRRREWDAIARRPPAEPAGLFLVNASALPWMVLPLFAGIWLALEVSWGREGGAAKKQEKDYWRKNMATYRDARIPDLKHVELDLDLFPERSRYHVSGKYDLINRGRPAARRGPAHRGGRTGRSCPGPWTTSRSPPRTARGFLSSRRPRATRARQDRADRLRARGDVSARNQQERRRADGVHPAVGRRLDQLSAHHRAACWATWKKPASTTRIATTPRNTATTSTRDRPTRSWAPAPFTTKITITGPADFTINSVGTKTADTVKDGRRTVVWESDHPVSFFNVIAGRWQVERGEGTAIYYDSGHPYNIAEMRESLDAARRYYSEWFYPYPWRELKLSEFPNLASYAQGFPTNITFSEGIGFLTESSPENHAAFEITVA